VHLKRIVYILLTLVTLVASPAFAQRRVPDEGMMAAGGEVGFFVPDDEFETSPILGGLFEYYVSPRLGLRGSVLFMDPEFDRGTDDSLRHVRLGFDVIYNWEHGKWHPFAGGGVGVHMLQAKENGRNFGDSENELGLTGLGGVEYFFNRRTTFKIEGRFMFVDDFGLSEPSGFAATFGIKRYF
jgi:Outer membrane protein beta-barrel domain